MLLIIPFICPFFFLSNKTFGHRILRSYYQPESSNFVYTLREAKYVVRKKIQDFVVNFCLLFPFFLFPISHSNVIHRKICVTDFSGTSALRILKFGKNVGYDLLYCIKENQPAAAYHCFICPFFVLSKQIFYYKFLSFYESQSLQIFVYTLTLAKYIVRQKTKLIFILPSFSFFSISYSNVIHREICDKIFLRNYCM